MNLFQDIDTPSIIVDLNIVKENIHKYQNLNGPEKSFFRKNNLSFMITENDSNRLFYTRLLNKNEKLKIFKLLNAEKNIGVSLTDRMAMTQNSRVSGYYFSHPKSKYFTVGKIKDDQIKDYAKRKEMSINEVEKWLQSNI